MGERMRRVVLREAGLDLLVAAVVLAALNCGGGDVTPPPSTGTLEVTTSTSGAEQDPDGYSLRMDAGAIQAIGAAATLTTSDVTPGSHTVQLGEVAANCSVAGDNPRTVNVTAGQKATVAFAVTCSATSPTTGIIRVSVTTSGSPPDPDGYLVKLDGGDPGLSAGTSGSVSFTSVPVGSHTVALTGVAANCSVADGVSRTVTVTAGATSELSFEVTCAATTGTIKVTTVTTGTSVDADGYTVSVDGAAAQEIAINATLPIPNIAPGDHNVTLAGVASNCTAEGANPRPVAIRAGVEASVTFTVTCSTAGSIRWTTLSLPAGFSVGDIWASSPSELLVSGSYTQQGSPFQTTILRYDGHEWTELLPRPPAGVGLSPMWVGSATNIFAVSYPDEVWHYNGAQWLGGPTELGFPNYLAIWGTSAQNVFAVGWDDASTRGAGMIDHYDGTAWSPVARLADEGSQVWDIAGTSATDVYAVGTEPAPSDSPPEDDSGQYVVLHYDGSKWSLSFAEKNVFLWAVWPVSKNDVFVAGEGIFHFDGSAWSPMASPTTQTIKDVWGNASSNVFAVGSGGILRYDGTRWTVTNTTPGTRVTGAGTDVFVLTEARGILHGTP
jgi:hypothetical protein